MSCTPFQVALQNYVQDMVLPWSDLRMTEEEVVEGQDAVVVRNRLEGDERPWHVIPTSSSTTGPPLRSSRS